MAAAEGGDRVGTPDSPEHPGSFETGADHGLAAGLNDAGADEQVLAAELGIAHALGVVFEVTGFAANLLGSFVVGGIDGAKRLHQRFDFSLVQGAFLMDLHPGLLVRGVIGV